MNLSVISDKFRMKRTLLCFLFTFTFLANCFARTAEQLLLMGVVYKELDISLDDQLRLRGNSDFIIELEDSTGQKNVYYLQYNKDLNLDKTRITKVTVYAP